VVTLWVVTTRSDRRYGTILWETDRTWSLFVAGAFDGTRSRLAGEDVKNHPHTLVPGGRFATVVHSFFTLRAPSRVECIKYTNNVYARARVLSYTRFDVRLRKDFFFVDVYDIVNEAFL